MAGVPLAMADGERSDAGWCGEWVQRAGNARVLYSRVSPLEKKVIVTMRLAPDYR